jgi:hypothetical protein
MTKKVAFGPKPVAASVKADQWVERRTQDGIKRLTIDIPASLHSRIKAQCAVRGTKMADEIRSLLEERFP